MRIIIAQGDTSYSVYFNENETPIYFGGWKEVWFSRTCNLTDNSKSKILHIESTFRLDFWNTKYKIQVNQKKPLFLEAEKIFKGYWVLYEFADKYELIIHRGHKKSLFKNGIQIAAYDKKPFHLFESDTMTINCEAEESTELIIAMALCFDMGSHNDGSTATYDVGNISKGIRAVDTSWKPKK